VRIAARSAPAQDCSLSADLASDDSEAKTNLTATLEEALNHFANNQAFIANYGDRYRHGEPISSRFTESAVNHVVSQHFSKKQQMAWTDRNANSLSQVRTAVLNDEYRACFEQWYPSMAADKEMIGEAA
jgi:hypothetical protein